MTFDAARELRRAVDTGKVVFGLQQTKRDVLKGTCQLVIISGNAGKHKREAVEELCMAAGIPYYKFKETGLQLGSICGKPFVVSFACVEKPGKSKILDAVKKKAK